MISSQRVVGALELSLYPHVHALMLRRRQELMSGQRCKQSQVRRPAQSLCPCRPAIRRPARHNTCLRWACFCVRQQGISSRAFSHSGLIGAWLQMMHGAAKGEATGNTGKSCCVQDCPLTAHDQLEGERRVAMCGWVPGSCRRRVLCHWPRNLGSCIRGSNPCTALLLRVCWPRSTPSSVAPRGLWYAKPGSHAEAPQQQDLARCGAGPRGALRL